LLFDACSIADLGYRVGQLVFAYAGLISPIPNFVIVV